MQKGSITIYLALMLSVMLSLFLTVIEGARRNAVKVEADCAFDLAVYSVFAEYNRALFDRYHLLFVDSGYGGGQGSLENVRRHLEAYTKMNLSEGNKAVRQADFTATYLERAAVEKVSYATDEQAAVFERQAVLYIRQKYGLSYVEGLKNELAKAEEMQLFTRDVDGERAENQALIEEEKEKGRETGETDEDGNPVTEPFELENPADQVQKTSPSGILLLVIDPETEISAKTVDLGTVYSHTPPSHAGQGLAGRKGVGAADKLLFHAYIKDVCGSYIHPIEDGALDYQMEYIVAGNAADEENLKQIVNTLLLLRQVGNVTYLFTDEAKQGEAAALAASICSAAGVPYLTEPVKLTLLFAWAYAESVYDVRQLLKGKRVKIMKEPADWHFSLSGMLGYAQEAVEDTAKDAVQDAALTTGAESLKDGLSYEDYLMLMLLAKSDQKKVARMIDLAELDIRKREGRSSFRMENCIDAMELQATVGSKYGYGYDVERIFYYQ